MFRHCFYIFFALLLLNSCKTDFPFNAPYKQIDVIYGLMDNGSRNDTAQYNAIQYIKINKAFQNTGNTNANTLAGNPDTTNISDSMLVTLQAIDGSSTHNYTLIKIDSIPKNQGLFSNPFQYLWRTPPGFRIDPNATYILLVKDITTGNKDSSSTSIVQSVAPFKYPPANSNIDFTRSLGTLLIEFIPAANAVTYNLTFEIFYTETKNANHQSAKHIELDYPIFSNEDPSAVGLEGITGAIFYNFLGSHIALDTTVYRHIDSFYVSAQAAGQQLFNYIDVNNPSIGVTQKTANYTNITNGAGVFSSRCTDVVKLLPGGTLVKNLGTDSATTSLRFK